jgi:hypothetical protein
MWSSKLKNKVTRNGAPSVNMNRGNSQFLENNITGTHQRQVSANSTVALTFKDRAAGFKDKIADKVEWRWRLQRSRNAPLPDPFAAAAAARTANVAPASGPQLEPLNFGPGTSPSNDVSLLQALEERELRIAAERRRMSLALAEQRNVPSLAPLDLDFGPLGLPSADQALSSNPFSDRTPETMLPSPNMALARKPDEPMLVDPFKDPENPFKDPPPAFLSAPSDKPGSTPKTGLSHSESMISNDNGNGASGRYSRYLSTTGSFWQSDFFGDEPESDRRGKGRSDPFDLERPELLRVPAKPAPVAAAATTNVRSFYSSQTTSIDREGEEKSFDGMRLSKNGGPGPAFKITATGGRVSNGSSRYSTGDGAAVFADRHEYENKFDYGFEARSSKQDSGRDSVGHWSSGVNVGRRSREKGIAM